MNIKQQGRVTSFIIQLILVGFICAFLFGYIADSIPVGGPVPYIFVSLFIFPIAFVWPLIKDLTELRELNTITVSERERLTLMIFDIQRYLKVSVILLLIFGIITAVSLYLVVVQALDSRLVLNGIGFFVGCTICIIIFILSTRIKLQNYRAKVSSRMEELKQSKRLLKRIQKKEN